MRHISFSFFIFFHSYRPFPPPSYQIFIINILIHTIHDTTSYRREYQLDIESSTLISKTKQ